MRPSVWLVDFKEPAPGQSLYEGERVAIPEDLGDYNGFNRIAKGTLGTIISYATPELKTRQEWPAEPYWVRLDGDATDSAGRLIDRRVLLPLGPA
jgi:hypothetical protein